MILCAVFILILVKKVTTHEQAHLHRDSTHRHANFAKRSNTILDVPMITSAAFYDAFYCAFQCLTHDQCISYNSAVFPDADGKFECQLLATDKYRSSKSLRSSKEFDHYSIKVSTFSYYVLVDVDFLYGLSSLYFVIPLVFSKVEKELILNYWPTLGIYVIFL